MANGDAGKCRLDSDLGCICDKEPVVEEPCGEVLNPQCDPDECKTLDGNAGRCKADADLGCSCQEIFIENPCSRLLNPQCKPEACTLPDGTDGRCTTLALGRCGCDAVVVENPCGNLLNPKCAPEECRLANGTVGLCKRSDGLCNCASEVSACRVDADCLADPWEVDCVGHWDCVEGACAAVCGKPCGDGTCDPEAGESADTCAEDCNACTTNQDCLRGEWCSLEIGECKGSGTCEIRPTQCPKLLAPVCGCDDQTYNNACFAAEAGVNVALMGACK
jgi:hypothetical protein